MKQGIHPKWYPDAQVICSCGNTFTVGATKPVIRTDVCSACHPFFTGEQRIVDTEGQVDRFLKRLARSERLREEARQRAAAKAERERQRAIAEFVEAQAQREAQEAQAAEEAKTVAAE